MKTLYLLLLFLAGSLASLSGEESISFRLNQIELSGPRSAHQILITSGAEGRLADLTQETVFTLNPEGIVTIDESGYLTPLNDGVVEITATANDVSAKAAVRALRRCCT